MTAWPDIRVLYEDDWLFAVDKPSGLAVHPGAGIHDGTLYDWIAHYLGPRALRNGFRASPAHRLDRETSGLVLVATRRPCMVRLSELFERREVHKTYVALVAGVLAADELLIDDPLADLKRGRPSIKQTAITRVRVLERQASSTLIECSPETGRKHQIRRHLDLRGHPILGDRTYSDGGAESYPVPRLFLHAQRLFLPHPRDGKRLELTSELPSDLIEVLTGWRRT